MFSLYTVEELLVLIKKKVLSPLFFFKQEYYLCQSKRKQKFALIIPSYNQWWHIALFSLITTWKETIILLKLIQIWLEFLFIWPTGFCLWIQSSNNIGTMTWLVGSTRFSTEHVLANHIASFVVSFERKIGLTRSLSTPVPLPLPNMY